jgi:hypothetical protein
MLSQYDNDLFDYIGNQLNAQFESNDSSCANNSRNQFESMIAFITKHNKETENKILNYNPQSITKLYHENKYTKILINSYNSRPVCSEGNLNQTH